MQPKGPHPQAPGLRLIVSLGLIHWHLWMVALSPFRTVQKAWKEDSPNTKDKWFPWFQSGAEFLSSISRRPLRRGPSLIFNQKVAKRGAACFASVGAWWPHPRMTETREGEGSGSPSSSQVLTTLSWAPIPGGFKGLASTFVILVGWSEGSGPPTRTRGSNT